MKSSHCNYNSTDIGGNNFAICVPPKMECIGSPQEKS